MRARIHVGEFRPGVKLSIDGLASELGVSRTPVHDAFGQLKREGLVTITSRVGALSAALPAQRRKIFTGGRKPSDH
jgi:DNA-binding GntR family transcriptional regulator